jgi:hypothetical protein
LIKQVQNKNIKEYLEKLREIERETKEAEESYKKIRKDIERILKELPDQRERAELTSAIKNCEELIKLAKSIKMDKIVDEYSTVLKDLKIDLDFEKLKKSIKKLNDKGITSLENGDLKGSINKFEEIQKMLKNYV